MRATLRYSSARRREPCGGAYRLLWSGWAGQALANPGQLPTGELDNAVEYNDESEETFLHRLWRDLYGDEPI